MRSLDDCIVFSASPTCVAHQFREGRIRCSEAVDMPAIYLTAQVMTAALLQSPAGVAQYNAATKINQFVDTPSFAAAEVLFPKSARASEMELWYLSRNKGVSFS